MHQKLGDLTPVRAVLALGGLELDGAHDAAVTLCNEQNHSASEDSCPPVTGGIRGQRRVEAERRALGDGGETEDRQVIDGRRKIVASADAISEWINQGIVQLQDRAATVADQVMM